MAARNYYFSCRFVPLKLRLHHTTIKRYYTMLTIDLNENKQLVIAQTPTVAAARGQVLIKVNAAGVNRADLLQRQGKYPPPPGDSKILGLEVCGEVVALGEGVASQWLGQHVMALCAGGGYGEFVAVDIRHCMVKPATFSNAQGAAFCEVFLTAFDAIAQYPEFGAEHTVLVHAGASGVGTAAISLAKYLQAQVVVTVGSDEKKQFCLAHGADKAINYRQHNWREVMKAEGLSADLIIDPVAGGYLNDDLSVLNMDGRIVVLALLGGRYSEQFDGAKLLQKRAQLIGSTLRNRTPDYKAKLVDNLKRTFGDALNSGHIAPVIDSIFPWEEAMSAHQVLQDNANLGKVVLTHESLDER